MFVGRDEHLNRIKAAFAYVATSQQALPAPIVLTGVRGVGKTVMLEVAGEQAAQLGFVSTPAVALDRVSDNIRAIVDAVERAVGASAIPRAAWQEVKDRLANLTVEVNLGPVTLASEPARERAEAVVQRQLLSAVIRQAAQGALDNRLPGLVVLIDEVQEAPEGDLVVLANALQEVLKSNVPVVILMAGLPNSPDTLARAASFTERFDYRTLDKLTPEQAYRALVEPALNLGVAWESAAADHVLAAAAGSPFLIQKIGNETWQLAPRRVGQRIGLDEAASATGDVLRGLAGLFRGRLAKATEAEREFLTAMAEVADERGRAPVRQIAGRLGKPVTSLSAVRQSLIDKDLVASAGWGILGFNLPSLAYERNAREIWWGGES